MPNSSPTTAADLPLCSQLVTASRLKVSSNFRRSRTDVCFMGFVFHCSPNSLSVNSKQPHSGATGVHTVYLVYTGSGGNLFNVQFFGVFTAPPQFSHRLVAGNTYSLNA